LSVRVGGNDAFATRRSCLQKQIRLVITIEIARNDPMLIRRPGESQSTVTDGLADRRDVVIAP